MNKYHYATLKADVFLQSVRVPTETDSYLAMDADTRAMVELLDNGYRFIGVHQDFAVFEKHTPSVPKEVSDMLSDQ